MRDHGLASEREIDQWLAQLADGDRSVFEPIFRALYPRARRFAQTSAGEFLAEDIAQAALLRVFARASEFVGGRPALPWFYAIVANEIRSQLRKHGREKVQFEDVREALTDPRDDVERVLVRQELHRALHRAIASLDNASAEAIAAVTGEGALPVVEPATFRKRVSRAYARLRTALGGSYEG